MLISPDVLALPASEVDSIMAVLLLPSGRAHRTPVRAGWPLRIAPALIK
jgi:hypothetical protein